MWIAHLIIQSLFAKRKNNISLILSAISIAAGVLSVTVVIGVMNGLQDVLIKNLISIESYEYSGVSAQPLSLSQIKTQTEKIQNIKGINTVVPFIDEFALISTDKGSLVAHVRAIDSNAAQKDMTFVSVMQKTTAHATSTNGFIEHGSIQLGWALASQLEVYRGDVIRLTLPGAGLGFKPNTLTLIVSNIFYTASNYDRTWAFISLFDYAQSMAATSSSTKQNIKEKKLTGLRFGLRMKNTAHTMQGVQSILRNVRSWQENNHSFYFALKTEKTLLALLAAIIFAVIALHFRFTLRRRINTKRDDIVSLRTMGATPQNIRMWFLVESMCIGLLGIVLGLLFGLGIFFAYPKILDMLQNNANVIMPLKEIRIGFLHTHEVAAIILCTGIIIMISAYFAVRQVTKITPMQVLHYE